MIRLTEKAKKFLLPINGERVKFIGIADGSYSRLVKHDCRGNKHRQYSIVLNNVQVEINDKRGFIKRTMNLDYNYETSKFAWAKNGEYIEFYARIQIINDNLYIERPTKIKSSEMQL